LVVDGRLVDWSVSVASSKVEIRTRRDRYGGQWEMRGMDIRLRAISSWRLGGRRTLIKVCHELKSILAYQREDILSTSKCV